MLKEYSYANLFLIGKKLSPFTPFQTFCAVSLCESRIATAIFKNVGLIS